MASYGGKAPSSQPTGPQEIRRVMKAAVAEHRKGRLDSAIKGYRRVLDIHPKFPEAHNNLAVALRAAGQPEQAAASYRRALALRPRYPAAHANLASTLTALGQHQNALRHALEALRLDPGNAGHRRVLAAALRTMRFSEASPAIARAVESCFREAGIEHQTIVPAALSLLRLKPEILSALDITVSRGDEDLMSALMNGSLRGLIEDRLLQAVLTSGLVPDAQFERLFSALRRCCLTRVFRAGEPPAGLFDEAPDFIAALACQCFINDYAYPETDEESALVAQLGERLTADRAAPESVVWAMYRPLGDIAAFAGRAVPPVDLPPSLARLVRIQIQEPSAEHRLADDLPTLTAINDCVSGAVRRQYEANPYPRWLSTGSKAARPLAEVVSSLFPHDKKPRTTGATTRILVAGCGTGKHAADVATRYSGSEVLAVDLSRRSLAYAARKAGEAKLSNLAFAQADILELGALDRCFDLIEAVGVLHHLKDPLRGWQQLLGLLAPNGFMRIGLYSTLARRSISATRDFVRERGFPADAEGIRGARQAILDLEPDDEVRKVTGELDFYSLSGCRDLLFNVQEKTYDLPEVAEALERLGLEFIGFEFVDPGVAAAFRERHPEDTAMADLSLWHAFEAAAPDTFHNMYQFWCRKA